MDIKFSKMDSLKTSLEELVARLQYLKTPEGKTEHLR